MKESCWFHIWLYEYSWTHMCLWTYSLVPSQLSLLSMHIVELCWEQEAHCILHLSHTDKSVDSQRRQFKQFTKEFFSFFYTVLWNESAHLNFYPLFSPLFWPGQSGLNPAQSEFNYLNTARTLELYGVELHYARVSVPELFHYVCTHKALCYI